MDWIGINSAKDWFEDEAQFNYVVKICEQFNATSIWGRHEATGLSEADRESFKRQVY
jgi:hypothetical protein